MSEARFDIYFKGDLLDGFFLDFVKADMAQLFKTDETRLASFFSGSPQPIKLNVDKPTVTKYKQALEKIGARPIILPAGQVPVAEPVRPASVPNDAALTTQQVPEPDNSQPPVTTETSNWTLLPPGSNIGEQRDQTVVLVDISSLSLAEVGVSLVDSPEAPTPVKIDISALSLDEPGANLIEPNRSEPPTAPDVSHLKLE
jgi:hypothetical protein